MDFILFFAFIIIFMFLSWIIKKYFFKSDENTDEKEAMRFMQNYKISEEEKFGMELSSAINSDGLARLNLRRLIAAEIKARVLESALDPKAFPSTDIWAYEKSNKELEQEKKNIEDAFNKEKERINLAQEIRFILQAENISEEWLVANPKLFLNDLSYRAYIQTPIFARNNYKKLDDFGLIELNFCIKNKQKIIDAFRACRNKGFYS